MKNVELKCPKCGSTEILGKVIMHGYGYLDMQDGEVYAEPEGCDYSLDDLDEFICDNIDCGYEWSGEVSEKLVKYWKERKNKK